MKQNANNPRTIPHTPAIARLRLPDRLLAVSNMCLKLHPCCAAEYERNMLSASVHFCTAQNSNAFTSTRAVNVSNVNESRCAPILAEHSRLFFCSGYSKTSHISPVIAVSRSLYMMPRLNFQSHLSSDSLYLLSPPSIINTLYVCSASLGYLATPLPPNWK